MTLDDIVTDSGGLTDEEKRDDHRFCSKCLGRGEDTGRWYWRCPNDCEVVTYIPTDVTIEGK